MILCYKAFRLIVSYYYGDKIEFNLNLKLLISSLCYVYIMSLFPREGVAQCDLPPYPDPPPCWLPSLPG